MTAHPSPPVSPPPCPSALQSLRSRDPSPMLSATEAWSASMLFLPVIRQRLPSSGPPPPLPSRESCGFIMVPLNERQARDKRLLALLYDSRCVTAPPTRSPPPAPASARRVAGRAPTRPTLGCDSWVSPWPPRWGVVVPRRAAPACSRHFPPSPRKKKQRIRNTHKNMEQHTKRSRYSNTR